LFPAKEIDVMIQSLKCHSLERPAVSTAVGFAADMIEKMSAERIAVEVMTPVDKAGCCCQSTIVDLYETAAVLADQRRSAYSVVETADALMSEKTLATVENTVENKFD
jgi:hypothetical protein